MPKPVSIFFTALGFLVIPFCTVTMLLGAFRLAGVSGSWLWVPTAIGLVLGILFLVFLLRPASTTAKESPSVAPFHEWAFPVKLLAVAGLGLVLGLFAAGLPILFEALTGSKSPADSFWEGCFTGAFGGLGTFFVVPWLLRRKVSGSR